RARAVVCQLRHDALARFRRLCALRRHRAHFRIAHVVRARNASRRSGHAPTHECLFTVSQPRHRASLATRAHAFPMNHIVVTLSTSLGPFTLAFDREETLLATAFGDARAVLSRL